MNEYEVTVVENGHQRKFLLQAASAAQARERAEDDIEGEVTAVRFVHAASFSCTIRDGCGAR